MVPLPKVDAASAPFCGECGTVMQLLGGPYGPFWGCTRFPTCKGRHGAHPDGRPLGIPTDAPGREARIMAHTAFDAYRKKVEMTRSEAYAWLAGQLRMTTEQCHISRFDKRTCDRVAALCLKAALR